MRSSRHEKLSLRETAYRFLFEQGEEEAAGTEEETEDAAPEEDAGDAGDEAASEEPSPEAGEPAGEDADQEKEEPVSLTDKLKLSDSLDNELEALLVDYEEEARKSAEVNKKQKQMSGVKTEASLRFLLEDVSEDVDLRHFAANVARLVKNYQNLIDWKSVILNKVEAFITSNYGEDTAKTVLELLELDHGLVKQVAQEEPETTPIAVGAREAGGG